jgi:hypothetical protein
MFRRRKFMHPAATNVHVLLAASEGDGVHPDRRLFPTHFDIEARGW